MRPLTIVFLLAATLSATAQGGFAPGTLVIYSPALKGLSSAHGGVARIDPATGQTTTLALLTGSSVHAAGSVTYDPFRDRVLFGGSFSGGPSRLWASDAAGNLSEVSTTVLTGLTPGQGGRIYARGTSPAIPIVYLDAANQIQPLLDASGSAPFQPPSWDTRGMLYHPGLNALFVATQAFSPWSCGASVHASLHRVRLSDDGTRALAIDACASLPVDVGGGGVPVGLSLRPDGRILAVVDTNSNAQQPRMLLVEPDSLALSTFASNGSYTGAAATNAGTWSSALGRAVILDTFSDGLRSFGAGETGNGNFITPSEMISAGGSSGEVATLIEVALQPCAPTIGLYCTAKTTSNGCLPALSTQGCPSASLGAGFVVRATQVPPLNLGLLLYGTNGPAASPALGGTLCVATPFIRTAPSSAGGAGACGGQYAFDFNAWVPVSGDPALVAGAVVHGQFWFRDPPASFGSGLSGGVTFTLAP